MHSYLQNISYYFYNILHLLIKDIIELGPVCPFLQEIKLTMSKKSSSNYHHAFSLHNYSYLQTTSCQFYNILHLHMKRYLGTKYHLLWQILFSYCNSQNCKFKLFENESHEYFTDIITIKSFQQHAFNIIVQFSHQVVISTHCFLHTTMPFYNCVVSTCRLLW